MNPNTKTARVAGLLYLTVIASGVFANLIVRSSLIVPGDVTATANNILASELLFRLGFVSELIHMTSFFFLTLTLFLLFKPVNQNLASLAVLFALVAVPIELLNTLNNLVALSLLSGADYLTVFTTDQLNAQAMLFLNIYDHGYMIAQIFMGFWMLPLGYLVFKSDMFPKSIGVLMIIGCFGLLLASLQHFLFPGYEVITYPGFAIAVLAEISFCLWLIVKGVKNKQPLVPSTT